jgi:hypothetical protein
LLSAITTGSSAYVYFEDEPGRRAAAKLLSNDQAYCIGNIDLSRRWNLF